MYYESEIICGSSLHHIFESANFRFPFFYEKMALIGKWNVKIKLLKIVGNKLDKLRKLYMNGKVI